MLENMVYMCSYSDLPNSQPPKNLSHLPIPASPTHPWLNRVMEELSKKERSKGRTKVQLSQTRQSFYFGSTEV
jgi:hypothetical protein